MAQEKIIIKFEPKGDKGLINAINRLNDATKKLQGKYKELGKSSGVLDTHGRRNTKTMTGLGNTFSVVRSKLLLLNFAMALGVRQLVSMAKESAKLESMERAFTTLSGGAEGASIAVEKLQSATDGTMSQFDLFQQANNAMILGVSKNSDEMAEMFDIAQRLGRALGRDTRSSVESLITGIGRQSRLMLDNIGIIVKADEAYEQYATKLGTTADKLTDAEKKQAFLTATMESARAKVASLGAEVLSSQDSFDRFSSTIKDLSKDIGNFVLKGLNPMMDAFSDLVEMNKEIDIGAAMGTKSYDDMVRTLEIYRFQLVKATDSQFGMRGQFLATNPQVKTLKENIETLTKAMTALETAYFVPREDEVFEDFGEDIDWSKFLPPIQTVENAKTVYDKWLSSVIMSNNAKQQEIEFNEKLIEQYPEIAKQLGLLEKKERLYYATSLSGLRSMIKSKIQMYFAEAVAGMMAVELSTKGIAGFLVASAGAIAIDKLWQDHVPQFQQGGVVGGNRHSQGGTIIEAERGEFVMNRKAVDSIGVDNLNAMNQGGGGSVTVNINGGMVDQNFVENELAEAIKTAIRRGSDFGVA